MTIPSFNMDSHQVREFDMNARPLGWLWYANPSAFASKLDLLGWNPDTVPADKWRPFGISI